MVAQDIDDSSENLNATEPCIKRIRCIEVDTSVSIWKIHSGEKNVVPSQIVPIMHPSKHSACICCAAVIPNKHAVDPSMIKAS